MAATEITSRTTWAVAFPWATQASLSLFSVRVLSATSGPGRALDAWPRAGGKILVLPLLTFLGVRSFMKLPSIRRTGSAARLLLIVQTVLGASLQNEPEQVGLRHPHLAMAIILIVLAGIDVVLNG